MTAVGGGVVCVWWRVLEPFSPSALRGSCSTARERRGAAGESRGEEGAFCTLSHRLWVFFRGGRASERRKKGAPLMWKCVWCVADDG